MSYPISPTPIITILCNFQEQILFDWPNNSKQKFYKRYVDNICLFLSRLNVANFQVTRIPIIKMYLCFRCFHHQKYQIQSKHKVLP